MMNEKRLISLLRDCAMDKEDICDSCEFAEGECSRELIREAAKALEKRDQGCEYCNSCQVCEYMDCGFEGAMSPAKCSKFEPRWNYCPKCGRKLVE